MSEKLANLQQFPFKLLLFSLEEKYFSDGSHPRKNPGEAHAG